PPPPPDPTALSLHDALPILARRHLSGQRWPRFIRTHWLDTLVLLLPLLRPVRIVQAYETVQRRRNEPRLSLHARVIAYAGLSVRSEEHTSELQSQSNLVCRL